MSDATIIRMTHIREARLCASGARTFFKSHGLDWTKFLASGITAGELRATGSDLCERVIVIAEREESHG